MKPPRRTSTLAVLSLGGRLVGLSDLRAEGWPMSGRDQTRNAGSPAKDPPTDWHVKGMPKKIVKDKVVEQHADAKNVEAPG